MQRVTQPAPGGASGGSGGRFTAVRRVPAGAAAPQVAFLTDFVAARQEDTRQLVESLGEVPALPRHLRRRARSWKPYGPPRCRADAAASRAGPTRKPRLRPPEAGTTAAAAASAAGAATEEGAMYMRIRRHWRRPGILLRAHAWAPPSVAAAVPMRWLETHMWHTRRSAMENIWGLRLAAHNSALGRRALHRAAVQHACVHDRSYLEVLEVSGREILIAEVLELCGIDRRLTLASHVRQGTHRASASLCVCRAGNAPSATTKPQLVAPVLLLWRPPDASDDRAQGQESDVDPLPFQVDVGEAAGARSGHDTSEEAEATPSQEPRRRLWIWVHPAAASDATASLARAVSSVSEQDSRASAAAAGTARSGHVELQRVEGAAFLELIGQHALEVLARVVPPGACSGAAAALWAEVAQRAAGTRLVLPPGAALALDVDFTALRACATALAPASVAGGRAEGASAWLAKWPSHASAGSRIWDWREEEQAFRAGREGEGAKPGFPSVQKVPVIFVFRRGDLQGHGAGADVLLPPRSGVKQLWLRTVFASTRTLGFRDRHALLAEAGIPDFPFDYPETAAGEAHAAAETAASAFRHQRRPPAKRVNFAVLGVPCPHAADWRLLVPPPAPERPHIERLALAGLGRKLADCSLIAVTVQCPGRGAPKSRCHLFCPMSTDYSLVGHVEPEGGSRPPSSNGRAYGRSGQRPPAWASPGPPEPGAAWDRMLLEEPLHKGRRLRTVRKREQEASRAGGPQEQPQRPAAPKAVEGLRPLVGFLTSGCYSHRQGCGVGCGAITIACFERLLHQQPSVWRPYVTVPCTERPHRVGAGCDTRDLAAHWVLLWARNTTSRAYFPVWARTALNNDGPA